MDGHLGERLAGWKVGAAARHEWMRRVVTLLEAAVGQLHDQDHPAQGTLLKAASLLRQQLAVPADDPAAVRIRSRAIALAAESLGRALADDFFARGAARLVAA